ncbi:F-box domain protein [Aspergillus clavatus NRRL 1]|uniref:F-box domain protein n=1 Tax=Aspergillus clavatus (strain ATCC 1007 / CBS 513.65 / DSM 816 / NCTC 3887 / NRRL 1 / QM 1276 / 107) TaxID=344612 RepID=A1CDK0_ASPCL|nr:F-box domain protein [Aspergillus clavatus NRRL 1]EAW11927.1 F-box domain protein [Aspergillus clavatus NRRL 1]
MSITKIPMEILDLVLSDLDLTSIKALRLTSRSFSTTCMTQSFLDSLRQPETDLSEASLVRLDALASNPVLRQHCHTLVILAPYHDSAALEKIIAKGRETGVTDIDGSLFVPWSRECSKEELARAAREVAWLKGQHDAQQARSAADAIRTLAAILRRFATLDTIRLDAALRQSNSFDLDSNNGSLLAMWAQASWAHDVTMAALARSRVSVRKLDIYRTTTRCGIPCGDYGRHLAGWSAGDLSAVGGGLEALSLSLSTDIDEGTVERFAFAGRTATHKTSVLDTWLSVQADYQNSSPQLPEITRMLQNSPRLSRLDLRLYHLEYDDLERYDWIFDSIATHVRLPELQDCKLSGFMVTENSLSLFLKTHPRLRTLSLRGLYLTKGTWPPILAHLSSAMPDLDLLDLSSLWTRDPEPEPEQKANTARASRKIHLLNLEPVWDTSRPVDWEDEPTSYRCVDNDFVVHSRVFEKPDLQQGLRFRQPALTEPMWAADAREWAERRHAEYGPPYEESSWSFVG